MLVTMCLKTRIMCVLNGPMFAEPEANKDAEKASRFTERQKWTPGTCSYGMEGLENLIICLVILNSSYSQK